MKITLLGALVIGVTVALVILLIRCERDRRKLKENKGQVRFNSPEPSANK